MCVRRWLGAVRLWGKRLIGKAVVWVEPEPLSYVPGLPAFYTRYHRVSRSSRARAPRPQRRPAAPRGARRGGHIQYFYTQP